MNQVLVYLYFYTATNEKSGIAFIYGMKRHFPAYIVFVLYVICNAFYHQCLSKLIVMVFNARY